MRPIFMSALYGLCLTMLAATPGAAESGWSLDKQEDGIDVYTRPVEGSGIKQFKGSAEVAASVDAVFAILRDSDNLQNWFPNTSESRLLERNEEFSVQYSVMDAPWPISDRDNVLRSTTRRDAETGVAHIRITAAPDFYPEQANRVRVRKANGTWKVEPLAPGKSRVTFSMHLEPGGGIPKWLTNARVVATPFEALTNLRAAARQ